MPASSNAATETVWDEKARLVQKMVVSKFGTPINSFKAVEESQDRVCNGFRILNDLPYANVYPNSFLDLRIPERVEGAQLPLLLYFHGGGFLFGSKSKGDPLAKGNVEEESLFRCFLERGYAVASADYALAPDYRFPVPILQVDQALQYLSSLAKEYGLDMDRIVLMGGSAGADMVEIYCAALTNPGYAEALGLSPCIHPHQVEAVVIDEAALAFPFHDDNMNTMLGSFLGENDMEDSLNLRLASAHHYLKPGFPPAFVTASNEELFFKENLDALLPALQHANVTCQSFFPKPECYGTVPHGFLVKTDTQASKDALKILFLFLDSISSNNML